MGWSFFWPRGVESASEVRYAFWERLIIMLEICILWILSHEADVTSGNVSTIFGISSNKINFVFEKKLDCFLE